MRLETNSIFPQKMPSSYDIGFPKRMPQITTPLVHQRSDRHRKKKRDRVGHKNPRSLVSFFEPDRRVRSGLQLRDIPSIGASLHWKLQLLQTTEIRCEKWYLSQLI